jgi:hypothetical protein
MTYPLIFFAALVVLGLITLRIVIALIDYFLGD